MDPPTSSYTLFLGNWVAPQESMALGCLSSISLGWGLSAGPDPKGSHVFPGSPQVLSRAGAAGLGCRQPGDESCGAASGSFPRLGTGS